MAGNNVIAIDNSDVATTLTAFTAARLVASGTFRVDAANTVDVTIYDAGGMTTSALIPAGMETVWKGVDLSQVLLKASTSGQRVTFLGDTGE
jgi:hypothetical protein